MSRNERQFLHDLSSPVSVALGMVERLVEELSKDVEPDDKSRVRAEKAFSALLKIKKMILDRRAELIASDPDGADF